MTIDEENYIKYLRLKNEKALDYVIGAYGGLIKSVLKKHLGHSGSNQDIDECMNDVFIAIWHNIGYFDPARSSFKNWAAGIARYKALDRLRKNIVNHNQYTAQEMQTDLPYNDPGLSRIIEAHLSEELEGLLQCLNEKDRMLFKKIYIEDKTVDIVSKETGIKRETIYSRISRSRKKLKNKAGLIERSRI